MKAREIHSIQNEFGYEQSRLPVDQSQNVCKCCPDLQSYSYHQPLHLHHSQKVITPPTTGEAENGPETQQTGELQPPPVDPIIDQGPAKRMKF
ncbi:hypothetical protein LWI29_022533 [Acer saccharum]|uniref:Uncharacterized protein n=1 Tax=Acer saccharum TaxID=4024 RepID=A0AA39SQA5_ACESA|nr:hypothetical protein LWI29_022533 [Acer saccharum]